MLYPPSVFDILYKSAHKRYVRAAVVVNEEGKSSDVYTRDDFSALASLPTEITIGIPIGIVVIGGGLLHAHVTDPVVKQQKHR